MMDLGNDLDLLLWDEKAQRQALSSARTEETIGQLATRELTEPDHLGDDGADPNLLPRQRWGLIVPAGAEGKRLREIIAPLVKLREEQMGVPARVYECPPKMDMADAAVWRKTVYDNGKELKLLLPRYQLILGNLDQVPLSVQQVQQADGFVGRLAFDDEKGYEAYVDKVVQTEKAAARAAQARAMFFTVHDGTAATMGGHQALIEPASQQIKEAMAMGEASASQVVQLGDPFRPSPDELLRAVADQDPAVLFSLSHGLGLSGARGSTVEERLLRQGAMSFKGQSLVGADIGERTFLPGGVWFMLACFGAGTPDTSPYYHWLQRLKKEGQFNSDVDSVLRCLPGPGERPFIAALPQAVLKNPNGPLAFMGHVDLAWSWSFQERDSGTPLARPTRFASIVWQLLNGSRVGIALRELMNYFGAVNGEITSLYDRAESGQPAQQPAVTEAGRRVPTEEARRGNLWMLRQDLAGYILLGDPAVRLPIAAGQAPASAAPPPAAPSVPTINTPAASQPTVAQSQHASIVQDPLANVPLPLDLATFEEVVAAFIVGEQSIAELAAKHQVDRGLLKRFVNRYIEAGRGAVRGR